MVYSAAIGAWGGARNLTGSELPFPEIAPDWTGFHENRAAGLAALGGWVSIPETSAAQAGGSERSRQRVGGSGYGSAAGSAERRVRWVEVSLDADVDDGEGGLPAKATARFSLDALACHMGYPAGEADDADALVIAEALIEHINSELEWDEEPWTECRVKGSVAAATLGPGVLDSESWRALVERFADTCALYGIDEWSDTFEESVQHEAILH